MGEGQPSHAHFTPPAQVKPSLRRDGGRPLCAVIGAGPAGLFAAETLARAGARVTIYDHKPSPARKFLMAGRGGLNITHSEPLERFISRYGASFKASPLLRAWLARLARLGVVIAPRHSFLGFAGERVLRMSSPESGQILHSVDAVVLAMGGASWPRLGSDGGWVKTLAGAGVDISPLQPANAGFRVAWSALYRADFEGQPIKNVTLRHHVGTARGDIVITRSGLEGGPVYTLSSRVRAALAAGEAEIIHIDLRPDVSLENLARKFAKRPPKQSHATFLRRAGLSRAEIGLLREATPQGLPRDAEAMVNLVKNAPLAITGVSGIERAISTAGGVCFEACDDRLMLRQLPGVFVAGEMLDFDAPTGGYLLQAAFATGRAAGLGAAEYLGLSGVKEAFADTDHAGFAPRHLPNSLELAASNK